MNTKAKKRQKLCLSCDASVDVDVIVCPYCGADLTQAKENLDEEIQNSLLYPEQNISPLYPSQYPENSYSEESSQNEESEIHESEEKMPVSQFNFSAVLPIFLFSLGVMLFTLGLFVLVFSTNGQAILKWNAKYWFLYILLSIPFVIFGYKSLDHLEDTQEN